MKTLLVLALTCALSFSATALAQDKSVPPVVAKGFQTFQKDGPLAAIDVWMAGSVRETDDDFQDQAVARLNRIRELFGRMIGFEPIRTVNLSASTQRVYTAVKFEKGVAWMSFDCYKPDKEWIVVRFDFQTNANVILPPNILGGQ
jgi:hypothetical protein